MREQSTINVHKNNENVSMSFLFKNSQRSDILCLCKPCSNSVFTLTFFSFLYGSLEHVEVSTLEIYISTLRAPHIVSLLWFSYNTYHHFSWLATWPPHFFCLQFSFSCLPFSIYNSGFQPVWINWARFQAMKRISLVKGFLSLSSVTSRVVHCAFQASCFSLSQQFWNDSG